MRVLITGGNGYLGGRLAELYSAEHDVVVLARRRSGYPTVVADITDSESVRQAFNDAGKIDLVIHLAGLEAQKCGSDPETAMRVNRDGTKNVVEAAGDIPVLYFSSIHVYGNPSGIVTEDTAPKPVHPYGESKLAGEQYAPTVIRLSNAVGPPANKDIGQWHLVLLDLCRMAHEHGEVRLNTPGYQQRDFIAIEDVYNATVLLHDQTGVFNVCSGKNISMRDVAKMVRDEYRKLYKNEVRLVLPDGDSAGEDPTFSNAKLCGLGWKPEKDIKESIRDTLRFCERFR